MRRDRPEVWTQPVGKASLYRRAATPRKRRREGWAGCVITVRAHPALARPVSVRTNHFQSNPQASNVGWGVRRKTKGQLELRQVGIGSSCKLVPPDGIPRLRGPALIVWPPVLRSSVDGPIRKYGFGRKKYISIMHSAWASQLDPHIVSDWV